MRYIFECGSCSTTVQVDCKISEKPDTVPCEECGGASVRKYTGVPHIGPKVKGLAGGSTDGLKGH